MYMARQEKSAFFFTRWMMLDSMFILDFWHTTMYGKSGFVAGKVAMTAGKIWYITVPWTRSHGCCTGYPVYPRSHGCCTGYAVYPSIPCSHLSWEIININQKVNFTTIKIDIWLDTTWHRPVKEALQYYSTWYQKKKKTFHEVY